MAVTRESMLMPLRFFIEVVVAFLGGLILWLALATHKLPYPHTQSWLMVSVVLMVWGAITFFRARGLRSYWVDRVAGFSLLIVGGLMLVIYRAPLAWVLPMFAAVGGVLVLRGLVGVVLVAKKT